MHELLTKADVRRIARLSSDRQIVRAMYDGDLAFIRIGRSLRFERDAVREWIASCRHRVHLPDDSGPLAGGPPVQSSAGGVGGRDTS
jgi:excisionase family DNA binding protein